MVRYKALLLLVAVLSSYFVFKVSLQTFFEVGEASTRKKSCFKYQGSDSLETVLSIELFRELTNETAILLEEHPDDKVYLCPLPGVSSEVWSGLQELILRRAWVRRVCKASHDGLILPVDTSSSMFIMRTINVNFCANPKTGTTTWKYHLLEWLNITTGNETAHTIHVNAFTNSLQLNNQEKEMYLEDSQPLTFTVTRHPHERLVSAYRDKIQRESDEEAKFKETLYRTVQGKTLQKVLESVDATVEGDLMYFGKQNDPVITFPEFVRYFIKRFEECRGLPNCLRPYHGEWWPMYVNCPPCDVDFDILAKTESHETDYAVMEHLLAASGIISQASPRRDMKPQNPAAGDAEFDAKKTSAVRSVQPNNGASSHHNDPPISSICRKKKCRLNSTIDRNKTRENVMEYMSQLTTEERTHLDKILYYDFLFFGYDPNEYS